VTARDDAAGLRERVEALAEGYDVEADSICPADEYDKSDKAWRVAHVRRRVAADLRALLAESTPAPAPAADGGEVEALVAVLCDHWPIPVFGCECMPTDDDTGQTEVLAGSWERHVADALAPLLADTRRTARAEGAEEIAAAIEAATEPVRIDDIDAERGRRIGMLDAARIARATGGPQ
jgi:hypothetical protein